MDILRDINWFAIQTKPNQESLAAVYIERLGVEVYQPEIIKKLPIYGQTKNLKKPLFPTYIFARFSPQLYLHQIRYARGVRRVVTAGETPLPVTEEIIDTLQKRVSASQDETGSGYQPGERVEVRAGLLRGLRGRFEAELSDHQRVALLLETVEYQARIFIEKHYLKSAEVSQ